MAFAFYSPIEIVLWPEPIVKWDKTKSLNCVQALGKVA